MNINAFIPFLSAILNLGLGIYVFMKGKDKLINKVYLYFSLAVFFYCMVYFGLSYCRPENFAALWVRIFNTGALFVVPTLFHLLLINAGRNNYTLNKTLLFFSYLAALASLFAWQEGYQEVLIDYGWGYSTSIHNRPSMVMFINSLAVLPYGLILLGRSLKSTISSYEHTRLRYVFVAFALSVIGIVFNFLPSLGFDVYHIGPQLFVLSLLIITHAMVHYRFLDIDIIVSNTVLAVLFIVPLLIVHSLIISLFLQAGHIIASIISALIIILIIVMTPYKQFIQNLVDKAVYRGRYDYQKVLQELTQTLVAMLDLEQLLGYIVQIIVQTLEVDQVVLFLESEEKAAYVIKAYYGIDNAIKDSFVLPETSGIIPWLKRNGQIFVTEEAKHLFKGKEFKDNYGTLEEIKAELVAPMFLKDKLVGVLTLGGKKDRRIFNQGDITVLNALAAEAAIAIENARLYAEAILDGLTKLYHHNFFQMRLKEEVARGKRYGHPISLLMIDIDHFKMFNDTYGHPAGDLVLKEIARILKVKTRETDLAARYGGEEFAVILPETGKTGTNLGPSEIIRKHIADSRLVAERLREAVENLKIIYEGHNLSVTISIGIACYDAVDEEISADDLIKKADVALYKAKDLGRNRVVLA